MEEPTLFPAPFHGTQEGAFVNYLLAALSLEQPAPETAGSGDIKPIGQIQIRVRIIICTHFRSLWWTPES